MAPHLVSTTLVSCGSSGSGAYSCSSSNAESLDRLLPPLGTGRSPRKRTTSQCKSEPPLLRTRKRTIYTAGRPPWYNEHGTQSKEAFVIGEYPPGTALAAAQVVALLLAPTPPSPPPGLGGGSASGKTTVARMIIEALDVPWVVLLSMDSFYKVRPDLHSVGHMSWSWRAGPGSFSSRQVLTKQQQEQAAQNNFNFDHPDAFDFDLIVSTLKKLKQGKSVQVPIYDFTSHSRKKDWVGPLQAGRQGRKEPAVVRHKHGVTASCSFSRRKRCMGRMSSSSRVSWPLPTRHYWK